MRTGLIIWRSLTVPSGIGRLPDAFAGAPGRDNPLLDIRPDLAFHHPEIKLGLQIQPKPGFDPEIALQSQCGGGGKKGGGQKN